MKKQVYLSNYKRFMVSCNFTESDIYGKADPILLALDRELNLHGILPVIAIPFQAKTGATNGRCMFSFHEETEIGIYYTFTHIAVDIQF
jgi:hypothetical protein